MNYTYKDLLEALQDLTSDELDMHVTVYDRGQEAYYQLNYAGKCEGDDKVSADQPILIINDPEETVSEPHQEVIHISSDIRSCEIWLEFADGSTLTTDAFLDMDKCIETQIRDIFFSPHAIKSGLVKSPGVTFKWKELGI